MTDEMNDELRINDPFGRQEEEQDSILSAETIDLNGRRFVVGLFWQVMETRSKREARKLATDTRMAYGLIRTLEDGAQVGLAKLDDPVKTGLPSLADLIGNAYRATFDNFIFLSSLPDGRYYLCVIREGAILPEGDVIMSDIAKISAIFNEFRAMGNWDAYILSPELETLKGYDQTTAIDANDVFGMIEQPSFIRKLPVLKAMTSIAEEKNKDGSTTAKTKILNVLKSIDRRVYYAIGLAFFLVFAGLFAYSQYLHKIQERRAIEEAKIRAKKAERIRQGWIIPLKWRQDSDGIIYYRRCLASMQEMPMFVGAWKMTTFSCRRSNADATYVKSIGATAGMLINTFGDRVTVNVGDDEVTVDVPLGRIPVIEKPDRIDDLMTVTKAMQIIDEVCSYNGSLQCEAKFNKLPDHVNPETEETRPMPYGVIDLSFNMPALSSTLPFHLSAFTIQSIEVDTDGHEISVAGLVYVKL